ncbi:MAG: ABC transporter ATP-binding protein [Bacilli bacterium]|jgi:ATP-binding cassette subfamily B protein|nr:ABC transporter ATP-binding protein [Bacilli bacterium]
MNARVMRGGRRFNFDKAKLEKGAIKRVTKRIWQYLKKYPKALVMVVVSILLASAFQLGLPLVIRYVIDDYIKIEAINLMAVMIIALSIIVMSIVINIINYIQAYLMSVAASQCARDIRNDAYRQLVNLPISYFDEQTHGDIISKITNDVDAIFHALSQLVPQLVTAVITIIGSLVLMLLTSWQLSIITLIMIPLMALTTVFITKKGFKHFRTQQQKLGTINGIVNESIQGCKVVKLYNQEEIVIKKFNKASKELKKATFHGQLYTGLMMPMIRLFDNIVYGLLVTVGAVLMIRYPSSLVSVGRIQAMTNYTKMSTRPINNLAQIYNVLQQAVAGGDRVFALIDEQREDEKDSRDCSNLQGNEVCFSKVSFGYVPSVPVLKAIDFFAEANKAIAIVGPTGSGKTTIINLLMRYYDPKQGQITIAGKNIQSISRKSLRKEVGIVLQTTYLFKNTIFENVRYGKKDASLEEVIAACKLAQVHDIIERLPNQYQTLVKEGGTNFSHGERQLLSIARTILYNPKILVLDEATSSVDTRTETKIQTSMGILVKNRTSFIIAHRLQTVKKAHMILVIKDGEIIEQGNHQELLNQTGFYYELYTTQFRDLG